MKITLESYGTKYTIETEHDDLNITEQLDYMVGLLHQIGFHKDSIKEAIIELADSLKK